MAFQDELVILDLTRARDVKLDIEPHSTNKPMNNNNLDYEAFSNNSCKLPEADVKQFQVENKHNISQHDTYRLIENLQLEACRRMLSRPSKFEAYMTEKMSRLENQEKLLLKRMKNVTLNDTVEIEKKLRKIKKVKKSSNRDIVPREEILSSPFKKNKKKRRSVSFNETVTEYYPASEDTSSEHSSRKEDKELYSVDNSVNAVDEGVEKDVLDTETKPFVVFDDLSRAERKKLKKKREIQKETMNDITNDPEVAKIMMYGEYRKRKLMFDDEEPMNLIIREQGINQNKQQKIEKQLDSMTKCFDVCKIAE